ncbi:MAG: ATP-grasp domain-containing protein [Campylobacterales bacterium]|nr:ATP-grasp domain-containing protein [Campylobacterales bacterium]
MKLTIKQIFYGANTYALVPIVLIAINQEEVATEHLVHCCKALEHLFGEYIDKSLSNDSTPQSYIGNTIATIALNLINKNGGVLGVCGTKVENETIVAWVEFDSLHVTVKAIEIIFKAFIALLQNQRIEKTAIEKILADYAKFTQHHHSYEPLLLKASKELDIPSFQYSSGASLYRQYGWGKNSRVFRNSSPIEDSYHGVFTSMDKAASKELLKNIGLPVAKDAIIHSKEQLPQAVEKVGYPCVVKPIRGASGVGITANIKNFQELQTAFDFAKQSAFGNNPILIEKFIEGDDHRLMVLDGEFVGAIKRTPTYIVGDGNSTIKQLIETINSERKNTLNNPKKLKQIPFDDTLTKHLKTYNLSMDDILEKNLKLPLNSVANYSAGGVIEDVTDKVHPQIKKVSQSIANVTQIFNLGIDYITTDIAKSYQQTRGAITEYNHLPSLSLFKITKEPQKLFEQLLAKSGKIPTHLIITDNPLATQIQNWLKSNISNDSIGWLCNHEACIGELELTIYNQEGWEDVKLLLRQKTLEKAIIVVTNEEIVQKGMPLDRFNTIFYESVDEGWYRVLEQTTHHLKQFNTLEQLFDLLKKG